MTRFILLLATSMLFVLLETACTGPNGLTGLNGQRGPEGPAGPSGNAASRVETTGQFDESGTARLILPHSAVQHGTYPVTSCYISPNPFAWITVSGPDCVLHTSNRASQSSPYVWMAGNTGWFYYIVALW